MIIVDDKLSLDTLAGRLDVAEPAATTWGFHFRLLRALQRDLPSGALGRATTVELRRLVAAPPPERLVVLDPRDVTARAAELAAEHGLNLRAAELAAAAVRNRAEVWLSAPNVGRRWPEALATEGITLRVV